MSSQVVVVTRHAGLVSYLKAENYIPDDAIVLSHAADSDVLGRVVWGVLPHNLSCLTELFIEVPLNLPPELRGVELTEEQVRKYAGAPVAYKVSTPDMGFGWACKMAIGNMADACNCLHPNGCGNCGKFMGISRKEVEPEIRYVKECPKGVDTCGI